MLTLSFNQILERLRTTDRLLLAVALLTAVALVYAGGQGLSWSSDYSRAGDLRQEALQLQTALANSRVGGETGTTTLEQYSQQWVAESQDLHFETNDVIIGLLNDIARDSRVVVTTTSITDGENQTIGPLRYHLVNATFRVEGQLSRIYEYLRNVSERIPTASIESIQLGGFGTAPWANVRLGFLIRPETTGSGK